MEDAMKEQIELLQRIDKELDAMSDKVDELTNEDNAYQEISQRCDATTKARINWAASFGVYTLYYLWLKLNEINPKDHPIKKEIMRLQEFHERIAEALIAANEKKESVLKGSSLDKKVAQRTISGYLGKKRRNDHKTDKGKAVKKYK